MEQSDGAKETMFLRISRQCLPGTLTWTTSRWEVGLWCLLPVSASLVLDIAFLHLLSRNLVTPTVKEPNGPQRDCVPMPG